MRTDAKRNENGTIWKWYKKFRCTIVGRCKNINFFGGYCTRGAGGTGGPPATTGEAGGTSRPQSATGEL